MVGYFLAASWWVNGLSGRAWDGCRIEEDDKGEERKS